MPIPNQPDAPLEGAYTDLELLLISEQPNRLWPENQNSNFGMFRKVVSDDLQIIIDALNDLNLEMFSESTLNFLGRWEKEVGLPRGAGYANERRHALIRNRRSISLFTRERRKRIVENFLTVALGGEPTAFTPEGIELTPSGTTLYSGVIDLSTAYAIIENVENFSYEVQIVPALDPDIPGLTRELLHMTPAHISFTITHGTPTPTGTFGTGAFGDGTFGG